MSSHGVARASRSAISALRAWKTSALTLPGGHPIVGGDLRVAQIAQLEEHECLALVVGQAPEVGHQLAQVGPAPDVLGQAIEAGSTSSIGTAASRRAASTVRQRLRAIANSQASPRRAAGRCAARDGRAGRSAAARPRRPHGCRACGDRRPAALRDGGRRGPRRRPRRPIARAPQAARRRARPTDATRRDVQERSPLAGRTPLHGASFPGSAARRCDTAHSRAARAR